MANITIQFADGSSHKYENVPDSATPDQVQARAEKDFAGKALKHIARDVPKVVPAPVAPAEKPGWFEPGSKSEAVARGFSQGATLGFGDEIQAAIRRVAPEALGGAPAGKTYEQIRDEERGANKESARVNPGSYVAGNLIGSAPSALASVGAAPAKLGALKSIIQGPGSVLNAAKQGARLGAVTGFGSAEGDVTEQALSTAIGAGLGGAVAGIGTGVGKALRATGAAGAGTNLTNANLPRAVLSADAQRRKDALSGGVLGGGAALMSGGPVLEGAALGAGAGYLGIPVNSLAGKPVANAIRAGANAGTRGTVGASLALTSALQSMSNQQTRQIKTAGDQKIQQAISSGTPEYAATFAARQDPAYRAALSKMSEVEDEGEDEE